MDDHLDAVHALKRQLEQARVQPSDTPSSDNWSDLFDAHIANFENHDIILNKVLSLHAIPPGVRLELVAMSVSTEQSRQAAVKLKGLLFSVQNITNLAFPAPPHPEPSTAPFACLIRISNLANEITAEDIAVKFEGYGVSNIRFVQDGRRCRCAIVSVHSGRMQQLACSEMNGKILRGRHLLVEAFADAPKDIDSSSIPPEHAIRAEDTVKSSSRKAQTQKPITGRIPGSLLPNDVSNLLPHTQRRANPNGKRKAVEELTHQSSSPNKRVLQATEAGYNVAASNEPNVQPVEYEDITEEVQRRLQAKEAQRQRDKASKMNPAGRKRLRESFESIEYLQNAEASPESKRYRDISDVSDINDMLRNITPLAAGSSGEINSTANAGQVIVHRRGGGFTTNFLGDQYDRMTPTELEIVKSESESVDSQVRTIQDYTPSESVVLRIGNLDWVTTEGDLEVLFKGFDVTSISIPIERSGRHPGHGFVNMSNSLEAERAISELYGEDLFDRKVTVELMQNDDHKSRYKLEHRGKTYRMDTSETSQPVCHDGKWMFLKSDATY
ncbi:hypothetical protein EJ05DRAFT_537461 [Pseudovirgaria hyperparasitica]|uniref:RRM domain-containing protein n=1 Tax=Pseudovirgaria hyperparasitica TaxID=470096 RepID=A0A6A6W8D3_9PEZI|nr:uncharacterized protein EJ05DRAFT_537461 [Pseudovirgaria hyperparasitica]KAF2759112.1 hypothetical protein EJ05DRAFT_537461 [Pseudovirgaria hyperparasitica]